MLRKSPPRFLPAFFGLLAFASLQAQTVFTIDPARSTLSVTNCAFTQVRGGTTLASAPLSAQGGGGATNCTGLIHAVLDNAQTPTSITFLPVTNIVAGDSGNWTPATKGGQGSGPGGSGEFPANFGLQGSASGVPVTAAVSGLTQSLVSGSLPLATGAFPVNALSVTTTGGNLAYRAPAGGVVGTIRGGGSTGGLQSTNAAASSGTYAVANGTATLTIPIDVSYTLVSGNPQGTATAKVRLTGLIVATATVP